MIGVLIVAGIVGYAMVYSGVSALGVVAIEPVTTLGALWPKAPGGTKPYTPSTRTTLTPAQVARNAADPTPGNAPGR